jgi:DNA-binding CsgD family transcriptional regulator
VRDRAVARRTIEATQRIAEACENRERDISEVLADAGQQFARLLGRSGGSGRPRLSCIEIRDFLALSIPARAYLLAPILPAQGLMMIHGPRGLGKTHLTVGIAVAVACGGTFLRWKAKAPAGVLLVDAEMPAAALQERLARAIRASEADIQAPLQIVTPDLNRDSSMPDLSTPDGQKAIDALVGDAKLIVLDNLSSLMRSGVENDAESWQPLQTWALRHRAQGRSIVFIHHSGKGGAQRGTVIGLRRPSDYSQTQGARFEVHIEKGRSLYGEDAAAFEAQLTADQHNLQTWTMKALEDSQDSRMTELIGLGMKPTEVAVELGIHKSTVYRHIGKSKANGHA